MEKENSFFGRDKNAEGKGGKYLENKNIFFFRRTETQRRKRRNIFGEGKYSFLKMEKEKEEIFGKKNISFVEEERLNGERKEGK